MSNTSTLFCHTCYSPITRYISPSDRKTNKSGNFYCSRSCAAKINGSLFPKRKRKRCCALCDTPIIAGRKYCPECIKLTRRSWTELSQSSLLSLPGETIYHRHAALRSHARRVFKKSGKRQVCCVCGYSLKIHVCHIKQVKEFPKTEVLSVINHIDNLVALCPNHHWELDHGLLKLEGLGRIELPT